MARIDELLEQMRRNPKNMRFSDICRVCDHCFGSPRQKGTSHRVYKMPWPGDPRINLQNTQGNAKSYQVKQVLKAIERLEYEKHSE
jgi:hypothetical protein